MPRQATIVNNSQGLRPEGQAGHTMRELFIYYRVHLQAVPAAKAAVVAMQTRLRQRHPGLSARLLCRAEPDAAPMQTWMETYAIDPMTHPAGITVELQAEIDTEARELVAWIDGPRHTEVFRPCAW